MYICITVQVSEKDYPKTLEIQNLVSMCKNTERSWVLGTYQPLNESFVCLANWGLW